MEAQPPVIVSDHRYADAGFQGARDIPTPHPDRLATSGARFTSGYATHKFCSPPRAVLLTGRYRLRFGHERNPFYDPSDHREGLPTEETLLPARLKAAGYATGWIGKRHPGAAPEFSPQNRSLTETYGFIGGGHRFREWKANAAVEYQVPINRNGVVVEPPARPTGGFGAEAAALVKRHAGEPWFLYLAFNATRSPNEPTAGRLARFSSIKDPVRQNYAAQVSLTDDAIGATPAALRENGQEQRTLVFFFSDDGGRYEEEGKEDEGPDGETRVAPRATLTLGRSPCLAPSTK